MSGLSASICDDLPVIYSYQLLILLKKFIVHTVGTGYCNSIVNLKKCALLVKIAELYGRNVIVPVFLTIAYIEIVIIILS